MATIRISELRVTASGAGGSEISLVGPATVIAGTSNQYTITDYDDFSLYTVSAEGATVTRTRDSVTLVVAEGETGIVSLKISRNGVVRTFLIGINTGGIATPVITYPSPDSTDVPISFMIQGSAFASIPIGTTTHVLSRFQVAKDSGFTNLVHNTVVTSGNLTQFSVEDMELSTKYYARLQYGDSESNLSAYSPVVEFRTTAKTIAKPVASIPTGVTNVKNLPVFTSSAFSAVPAGSDTLVSTSWVLKNAQGVVIWESLLDSINKMTITPPDGVLETSKTYTIEVKHNGAFSSSPFSDPLSFVTSNTFFPTPGVDAGVPFGGGYYVGCNVIIDGIEYALVIAPKAQGGESAEALALSRDPFNSTAFSENDGKDNTQKLGNSPVRPASYFAMNLRIGGHSDWYVPSINEMEAAYQYLKPGNEANAAWSVFDELNTYNPKIPARTQSNPVKTTVAKFQTGGEEALTANISGSYTTSSSLASYPDRAHRIIFTTGADLVVGNDFPSGRVRAFRRVRVTP